MTRKTNDQKAERSAERKSTAAGVVGLEESDLAQVTAGLANKASPKLFQFCAAGEHVTGGGEQEQAASAVRTVERGA